MCYNMSTVKIRKVIKMKKMKISEKTFVKNCDKLSAKLLDENQFGGAWFHGSKEEFEEWAGDVFFEALEIFINLCGIEVE